NMPGPAQFRRVDKWIDQGLDGPGPVLCGNACGTAMSEQVDRYGERRFMQGGIVADHQFKSKLVTMLFRQRHTDQATAMFGHEVYNLRRDRRRSRYEISFILTV